MSVPRAAATVYFLRPIGAEGPVKIGCSENAAGRLSTYMSWSPVPLEIVAKIEGGPLVERGFHEIFRAQHSHGEWFFASPLLTRTIQLIGNGEFDLATLPTTFVKRVLPPRRRSERSKINGSLRVRLGFRSTRIGVHAPKEVQAAERQLDGLEGHAYAEAVALIEEYIANPMRSATPMPYPWAKLAFAKYCARRFAA